MPAFNFVIETAISESIRARQLGAIFDVPRNERASIAFKGDIPIEERPWNVGLLVGPSGCGKSTLLRKLFGGAQEPLVWNGAGVIDDFEPTLSMQAISDVCQAVGFNTIPAWLRPYAVLSNGEKFRAELARRLIETPGQLVMDEFTSVVDRQVAQIGSHAVQKYVRREGKQFVAASCHYDIVEWLQPDWIFEPATMTFQWRSLQRRPQIVCEIRRVPWSFWPIFAPFHYMSAELLRNAKCFALSVENRLAGFIGIYHMPHAQVRNLWCVSRQVTLPDYQGLGLAFAFADRIGSLFTACGLRLRHYPAHPAFIRGFDRSPNWILKKKPGHFSTVNFKRGSGIGKMGGRSGAVFEYCGERFADRALAKSLLASAADELRQSALADKSSGSPALPSTAPQSP